MAKLFPPNIEGTIPAFYGTTLVVPFTMNRAVSILEVKGFALKMKTVQSQLPIYFNNGKDSYKTVQKPVYFDSKTNIITFQLTPEEIAVLNVGQYYKIQLAYIGLDDTVGYYSTVGVVKYTTKPDVYISGLEDMGVNSHLYKYRGVYSQKNKDVTEKAYSYCFNLYDGAGHLIQTSGEQIHNSINDIEIYETCDDYEIKQDLDINKTYYVEYIVTTSNKMQISSGRYRIMQKMSIDPEIRVDLVPELNYENGYITLHLIGHKNELGVEYAATGTFRILRSSDKEGYGVWHEILKFSLYGQQPSRWLWQDMTIEQGVTYRYALQQENDYGLVSNKLMSEEIYADFEHAFLYDGERQLKIKYNPKVTNFKDTILESKVNTLGGSHPFIFRNGQVKYKEFSIAGLISCQSDEEFLFIDEVLAARFENNSNLTNENILVEREFKLDVLEWLNDGKPKLFKSPVEGNYIIRLLNVSLTPNDTLGRMLHTFNSSACEIAEYTYDNLAKYNLINIGDPTTEQLRWETVELDKTGRGDSTKNLIKYKAASLHFEGMIPGDKLIINIRYDEHTLYPHHVTIGVTGSYIVDLEHGVVAESVYFDEGGIDTTDSFSGMVQHQGILTYSYYSRVQNKFDFITDFDIVDVIAEQYIGTHDVIDEINDEKTALQNIYWLKAKLRETRKIYYQKDNNGKYHYYESWNTVSGKYYVPQYFIQELETLNEIFGSAQYEQKFDIFYYNILIKYNSKLKDYFIIMDGKEAVKLKSKSEINIEEFDTEILNLMGLLKQTVQLDALVLYEVYTPNENIWEFSYLLDGQSDLKYSENGQDIDLDYEKCITYKPEEYDPNVYFNLNDKLGVVDVHNNMRLTETQEFTIKAPKDIHTLVVGNGAVLEIAYQEQISDYKIEYEEEIYNDLWTARVNYENAETELNKYLCVGKANKGDDNNYIPLEDENQEAWDLRAEQINHYQDLCKILRPIYMKELRIALEKEQEAQGELSPFRS